MKNLKKLLSMILVLALLMADFGLAQEMIVGDAHDHALEELLIESGLEVTGEEISEDGEIVYTVAPLADDSMQEMTVTEDLLVEDITEEPSVEEEPVEEIPAEEPAGEEIIIGEESEDEVIVEDEPSEEEPAGEEIVEDETSEDEPAEEEPSVEEPSVEEAPVDEEIVEEEEIIEEIVIEVMNASHGINCPDCGDDVIFDEDQPCYSNDDGTHTFCCVHGVEGETVACEWGDPVWDDYEHWVVCQGCYDTKDHEEHYAICTDGDLTQCAGCAANSRDYDDVEIVVCHDGSAELEYDANSHWYICEECGEKKDEALHFAYCHEENPTACAECGVECANLATEHLKIDYSDWIADDTYHGYACAHCGEMAEMIEQHYVDCASGNFDKCDRCGYALDESSEYKKDHWLWDAEAEEPQKFHCEGDYHYLVCHGCGEVVWEERYEHWAECGNPGICAECGYEDEDMWVNHDVAHDEETGEWLYTYDSKYHWYECMECGEKIYKYKHYGSCQNKKVCADCGRKSSSNYSEWSHVYKVEADEQNHYFECKFCDESFSEPHFMYCVDADYGVCSMCGEPYSGEAEHYYDEEGICYFCSNPRPAVSSIALPEKYELGVGEKLDLGLVIEPADAYLNLVFVVAPVGEDEKIVASVNDAWDTITGKAVGSSTVTVYAYDNEGNVLAEDTAEVVVYKAPGKVTVTPAKITLGKGDSYQLVSELPEGTLSTLTWTSSKKSVATVDENGFIQAVGTGSATITCKTFNGKKDTVAVTVKAAPDSISLTSSKEVMSVGQSAELETVIKSGKTVLTANHDYTMDGAVELVEFDETTGIVKAVACDAAQDVTFTVTDYYDNTASATITVVPAPDQVVLNDVDEITIGVGEKYTYYPTVLNGSPADMTYTANEGLEKAVVSVSGAGELTNNGEEVTITGKAVGSTIVTLQGHDGAPATVKVNVAKAPSKVTLSATKLTMGAQVDENTYDTWTLKATLPEGTASNKMTWSSSKTSVVEVDQNGNLKAVKAGSAKITVKTFNGKKATCSVTVKAAPDTVTVTPATDLMSVGQTIDLTTKLLTGTKASGGSYSYNEAELEGVLEFIGGGVKAVGVGEVTIVATAYNGVAGTAAIKVVEAPDQIILDDEGATSMDIILGKGETFQLNPKALNGSPVDISYDYDFVEEGFAADIATVDAGKITAKKIGETVITVNGHDGLPAYVHVTVLAAPKSIAVTPKKVTLGTNGDTVQLSYKLTTATKGVDPFSNKITWSSNKESVATVDQNGLVTTKGAGKATITVKAFNGKKATCTITVLKEATGVDLAFENDINVISIGQTATLETTLTPSKSAGTVKLTMEPEGFVQLSASEITTSSDITVTPIEGNIGDVTITAKLFNGDSESITLKVMEAPDQLVLKEGKYLNGDNEGITLGKGETYTLKPYALNGSPATVTYATSAKKKATVSAAGKITAKANGTAVISADPHLGLGDSVTVTVLSAPKTVTLSAKALSLKVGDISALTATLPAKTASKLTWTSSKPDIVRVDANGNLVAVGEGTAKITVSTFNKKKATCTVTVDALPAAAGFAAAYAGEGIVDFSWEAVEGAQYYEILSNVDGEWQAVAETDALSASVEGFADGKYEFAVRACVNVDGEVFGGKICTAVPLIVADKLVITGLSVNRTWVKPGEEVTWTASAVGGLQPYSFDFDLYLNSTLLFDGEASAESSFTYTLPEEGEYKVVVAIKDDAGNEAAKESSILEASEYAYHFEVRVSKTDGTKLHISKVIIEDGFDGHIIVPNSINGKDIIGIGDQAFMDQTAITSIEIAEGHTYIGANAFSGCTGLESIVIPESVNSIESNAFFACTALESFTVPSKVTTLEAGLFAGCSGLKNVEIHEGVTKIKGNAFFNCSSLETVQFPEGITEIADSVFKGCSALSSFEIPSTVETINTSAFWGCSALTGIEFPASVTTIDQNAFSESGLTSVVLPENLTTLNRAAFANCPNLGGSLVIPGSLKTIGDLAFQYSKITSLEIEEGVVTIGPNAFNSCQQLESISLPSSLRTISSWAFADCISLVNVSIPEGVETIGDIAFGFCDKLESINVPASVTSITVDAFSGYTRESSPVITVSYGTAGYSALITAEKLKVNVIGAPMSYYVNDDEKHTITINQVGEVTADMVIPSMIDGHNVTVIENNLLQDNQDITSVTILPGIQEIGWSAFQGCNNLVSVSLPSTLKVIEGYAFAHTQIKSVSIPSGVTEVGERAFKDAHPELCISFPSSVTTIGEGVVEEVPYARFIAPRGSKAVEYAEANNIPYSVNAGLSYTLHIFEVNYDGAAYGAGETGTWMPNVFGGDGNYQYQYMLTRNGAEVETTNFSSEATSYSYTFETSGDYILYAKVKDGSSETDFVACEETVVISVGDENGNGYAVQEDGTAKLTGLGDNAYTDNGDGTVSVTVPTQLADGTTVTTLGSGLFSGRHDITSVTIPEGITTIENNTFSDMNNLTEVVLPAGVTTVEERAFQGCNGLESVTIPAGASVGEYAFENCGNLRNVTLEEGVTEIGEGAFHNCGSLEEITLPASIGEVSDNMFVGCGNLKTVNLGSGAATYSMRSTGITRIGDCAFSNCRALETVGLVDTITYIGDGAFENCNSLRNIELPAGLTYLGTRAFAECHCLQNLVIPEGVTSILESTFDGCGSLLSVEMLGDVTEIGNRAFKNCGSLVDFTMPANIESIGDGAFENCHRLGEQTLPEGEINLGENVFGGAGVTLVVTVGSPAYHYAREWECDYIAIGDASLNGLCYESMSEYGVAAIRITGYEGDLEGTLKIPATLDDLPVQAIGDHAFEGFKGLTEVVLPDSIIHIGEWAFAYNDNLRKVTLPANLDVLDYDAFNGCFGLEEITIPASCTFMGGGAFANCRNLRKLTILGMDVDFNDGHLLDGSAKAVIYCYAGSTAETFAKGEWVVDDEGNTYPEGGIPYAIIGEDGEIVEEPFALQDISVYKYAGHVGDYAIWDVEAVGYKSDRVFRYTLQRFEEDYFESEWTNETRFVGETFTETGDYQLVVEMKRTDADDSEAIVLWDDEIITISDSNGTSPFRYVLVGENEVRITEYDGEWPENLEIPATIDVPMDDDTVVTMDVVEIGDYAFCDWGNLKSVSLPASVERIGEGAFERCYQLNTINLDKVMEIGQGAFKDCHRLGNITLADGLETIATETFKGAGLTSIAIPDSVTRIEWDAFMGSALESVTFGEASQLERLEACVFMECGNLSSISLPEGLEYIGGSVFESCESLEAIVVPDSVTEMGHRVFYNCWNLESAVLGSGITNTMYATFEECHSLRSITLPEGLEVIGKWAFKRCYSLEEITIPSTVYRIEDNAFESCHSMPEIFIPDTVTKFGWDIFRDTDITVIANMGAPVIYWCRWNEVRYCPIGTSSSDNLLYYVEDGKAWIEGYDMAEDENGNEVWLEGKLVIPAEIDGWEVYGIADEVFSHEEYLTEVEIEEGIEYIGFGAFQECPQLSKVTLPSTLTVIDTDAFFGCRKLTSVVVPENMNANQAIGYHAFAYCDMLEEVHLPASVTEFYGMEIEGDIIEGSRRCVLFVEKGSAAEAYAIEKGIIYNNGEDAIPFRAMEVNVHKWTDVVGDWAEWGSFVVGAVEGMEYNYILYNGDELVKDFGWTVTPTAEYTFTVGGNYVMTVALRKPDGEGGYITSDYTECHDTMIIGFQVEDGNLRYNFVGENEIQITSANDIQDGTLEIPATLTVGEESYTVVGIARNAFSWRRDLEYVTLPETLEFIDEYAFQGSNLREITIPANVESIGREAFQNCQGLDNVYFEEGTKLTAIEDATFNSCYSLYSIDIPEGVETIGWEAFRFASLDEVVLPSTLKKIGGYAFANTSLMAIRVPLGVEIEERAFAYNNYLETAYVGSTGDFMFEDCYDLTYVTLTEGITRIENYTFAGCESMVGADDEAEGVVIPEGVTYIGQSAFYGCESLIGMRLPSTVSYLGAICFDSCSHLEYVDLSKASGLDHIRNYAFANCHNLVSVKLPENGNLQSLGTASFAECWDLLEINIPETVTSIEEQCFYQCWSLGEVEIPESVEDFGPNIFQESSATLLVKTGSAAHEYAMEWGCDYVLTDNPVADDELIFEIFEDEETGKKWAMVTGFDGEPVGHLEIPASIETEDGEVIPVSVIGEGALVGGSNIMSVSIPASINWIGYGAFENCWRMRSVTIEEGSQLYDIGEAAFRNCEKLTSINIEAAEGLGNIYNYAFANCHSLESLTFPASMEFIGEDVFENCDFIMLYVQPESVDLEYAQNNGIAYAILDENGEPGEPALTIQLVEVWEHAYWPEEKAAWQAYTVGGEGELSFSYKLYRGGEFYADLEGYYAYVEYTFSENGVYTLEVTVTDEAGNSFSKFSNEPVIISEMDEETGLYFAVEKNLEDDEEKRLIVTGIDDSYAAGFVEVPATMTIGEVTYKVIGIGDQAFANHDRILEVLVAEGIEYIGYESFADMDSMTNVELPSTLKGIEARAFAYCSNLHWVTMAGGEYIGAEAFIDCHNLWEIELPESLREIHDYAFANCYSLELDTLPENVYALGSHAFENCYSLGELQLGDKLSDLRDNIFVNSGVTIIANVGSDILDYAMEWGFNYVAVGEADNDPVKFYFSAEADGAWITGYDGEIFGELMIPETFETVDGKTLPVTGIYDSAFRGQRNIMSVDIPASVKFIGENAFYFCDHMYRVNFAEDSELTSIGADAFANCHQLTEISLPEGLLTIGDGAFAYCSGLNEVKMPASLTEMGEDVFEGSKRVHFDVTAGGEVAKKYAEDNGIPYTGEEGYYDLDVLEIVTNQWAYNVGDTAVWSTYIVGEDGMTYYQYQLYRNGEPYGKPTEWLDDWTYGNRFEYTFTESGTYQLYGRVCSEGVEETASEFKAGTNALIIADYNEDTNFGYVVNGDDTVMISYMHDAPEAVVIPASLTVEGKELPVTGIGDYAFEGQDHITSVTLPDSVEYIGAYTFEGCSKLENITLSANLKALNEFAFYDCQSLKEITLPEGIETIADGAFCQCGSLTEVTVPDSVKEMGEVVFAGCDELVSVTLPAGLKAITTEMFSGCASLKNVVIPESVSEIQIGAFLQCKALETIEIPAGVKMIEESAFVDCAGLKTLTLNEGLEEIGPAAFKNCSSLEALILPDSVLKVRGEAFRGCSKLASVEFSDNLEHVTNWSFAECTSLTSIVVPASVGSIGSYTFCDCTSLESVTLPADGNLTIIEQSAFFNCKALAEIVIPDTVKEIGPIAFDSCAALESVTLSKNLTAISNYTFANCHALKSIVVPEGVSSIGVAAFAECYDLAEVSLPSTLKTMDYDVFYMCESLVKLTVPAGVESIGVRKMEDGTLRHAFADTHENFMLTVVANTAAEVYAIDYGIDYCYETNTEGDFTYTYNADNSGVVLTEYEGEEASVVVPATLGDRPVVEIGDYAFEGNATMTAIDLPDTVAVIGVRAFADCTSLASMT